MSKLDEETSGQGRQGEGRYGDWVSEQVSEERYGD